MTDKKSLLTFREVYYIINGSEIASPESKPCWNLRNVQPGMASQEAILGQIGGQMVIGSRTAGGHRGGTVPRRWSGHPSCPIWPVRGFPA